MDSRFIPRSGAPHYIGEPGAGRSDNRDGTLRFFPTSVDGTVDECTTFEDLATGQQWYFDGDGWKRRVTESDRVMAELREMRRELTEQQSVMVGLLTEMRDALLKIA